MKEKGAAMQTYRKGISESTHDIILIAFFLLLFLVVIVIPSIVVAKNIIYGKTDASGNVVEKGHASILDEWLDKCNIQDYGDNWALFIGQARIFSFGWLKNIPEYVECGLKIIGLFRGG